MAANKIQLLMCINKKKLHYIDENIMEARVLSDASYHLGSHASCQLIHERQKLVGRNLLHPFLEHKISEILSIELPSYRVAFIPNLNAKQFGCVLPTFIMTFMALTSAFSSQSEARRNTQVSCSSPCSRHWM